ncbi:CHAD domain-containing protein [Nakamurella endophytica]|uniref:CHAD domain-containing protein n=1 Tax=Nakamurella endophytica TaxID=1748367 RepID=A0A917SL90_9ACTN|nr:CHAD domain-containing protein [Nakamurella endophytica]GGL86388.1 CHAD domain-containing protein [Nakamurella endophytica]
MPATGTLPAATGSPGDVPAAAPPAAAPVPVPPPTWPAGDAAGPEDPAGEVAAIPPRPAPRRPGLIPTDVADALAAVLGKATAGLREHEEGSRHGADIESVHQMRVATRRIRAYLRAARPALDADAAAGLRGDLADLAGALGEVRDLDVMIDRLHREAAALGEPDTAALERVIGRLDRDRTRARRALVAALDDPGHGSLLAELDAATERPPVANPWVDLRALAADEYRVLAKGRRRLEKQFGAHPPDDDLHALRILGKRARYAAELLGKDRDAAGFLSALAAFQEVLGDHQDASVLEDTLRALVARSGDADAALAAGRVIQGCRERKAAARARYDDAWAAVEAAAGRAFPTTG